MWLLEEQAFAVAILRRCDFLCHLGPILVAPWNAKARLKTPSMRVELETNSDLTIPQEVFKNSLDIAERAPRAMLTRRQGTHHMVVKGVPGLPVPQAWRRLHFIRWAR